MNVKFGKFCINTFNKISRSCIEIFKLCQQILLKGELFLISNWKSTSLETGYFFSHRKFSTFFDVLLTMYLSIIISVINQHDTNFFFLFYNKISSCLYMFRAHVLIIRRSKLLYTASVIITPIGGRLFLFYDVAFIKFTSCITTISHNKYSTYGNGNDRHLFMD